jgi:hypothetical protein
MIFSLQLAGIALIVLGLVHSVMPKYLNWKEELKNLSPVNREIMQVHTFFIAFILVLMGLLSFFYAQELTDSQLGMVISGGLAVFWFVRAFCQFFIYSPGLWRGKIFETTIHIFSSIFWIFLTVTYGMAFYNGYQLGR